MIFEKAAIKSDYKLQRKLKMHRNRKRWIVFLLLLYCAGSGVFADEKNTKKNTISLEGIWRFALDSDDKGIKEKWFGHKLDKQIKLPGILQSQGFGNKITTATPWVLSLYDQYWHLRKEYKKYGQSDDVKVPFLCQPPRHYLGAAWYQREIEIPKDWKGRRIGLFLERARWETTVWIDNQKIGFQDSLVAPHQYELGKLSPGSHTLTIRVDNQMLMNYRPDAHSVSDSLGGTWNGIVGRTELFSTTGVWIEQVQAFGDIQKKSIRLKVDIGNITNKSGKGALRVGDVEKPVSWDAKGGQAEIDIALGEDAALWSEFNPVLHSLTLILRGDHADDSREVTFGLRQISTDGHHLLVNGNKAHFRGTHSGGDFPLTGYPSTDIEYWLKLFETCKKWGLNHVRFHSFCPPEAAFEAADKLGIYLQPEAGMWNEINPGSPMEKRLYEETDRMLRAYGNHPSFVLLSPSNEPKGRWKESLPRWVEHYRNKDARRLYTTGTGWPLIDSPGHVEGADFLAVHRIGRRPVRGNSAWFGRDYLDSMKEVDVPIIVHELGQWCAYPDFDVIKKFTGYMRPGNYEIFKESMEKAGLLKMNKKFAMASGLFQLACYKEEIEANLRTPGLAGFQLLDLHDYVGQGTALVGVLDAFWEEKGYVEACQWRRFCNTTVPLAILKKRVFTTKDSFEVEVQAAHYGQSPIDNAVVYWKICSANQQVIKQGQWSIEQIPLGSAIPLGHLEADLSELPAPAAYKLVVGFADTQFENSWNFWLYPADLAEKIPSDIVVTRLFNEALQALQKGRKVLFIPQYNQLCWQSPPISSLPIFWNRLMGPKWERFLGLVCENVHPSLAKFPTDFYYDWQWTDALGSNCRAINMDMLPNDLKPIVQVIDDWNRNYKLGILFECKVGKGKLLVCAADLENNIQNRPAAAQLRQSLLSYISDDAFNPAVEITPEQFLGLKFDNQIMKKLGAVAQVGKGGGAGSVANAIDGNPNTYWITARGGDENKHPHELIISFPGAVEMTGLILMNRQDHREHQGDIRDYVIEMSQDGKQWSTVTKDRLESTFDPQEIDFEKKIAVRYLKIRALSGFGRDSSASLAEIAVIYAGPELTSEAIEKAAVYRNTATSTEDMYEAVNVLENSLNPTAAKVERVTADSESTTDPAAYVLDGDSGTFWHTQWRDAAPKHPHWLMLEFKEPLIISSISYLPRQDRTNGRIKDYYIEVSMDQKQWQQVAKGRFEDTEDEQTVRPAKSVQAKYMKLTIESECQDQPFASIAELTIQEK
ncbi:MAG: discoidin domain-containing protein [Sedimentisphaerales bacterium]|nr:discoidin domain-containing protein [Sedimentisphaerales bacterium]